MRWKKPAPRPIRWPDLSLRAKGLWLISLPAAATVVTFGAANFLAARNAAAAGAVNRAHETAEQIQRLRAAETETAAEARAYFLTSDESFTDRALAALASFDAARQRLATLTADRPPEQRRLARIAVLEHFREQRMFGGMARFGAHSLPDNEVGSEVREVEAQRREIEELLLEMDRDNAHRLQASLDGAASLHAEENAITALCLFFGLAGGVAMTLLFARGITARVAALAQNLERLAAGASLQPLRGRDEIGALNQGLLRIAEILRGKAVALEHASHGIAEVDAAGQLVWWNRTFADLAGWSADRNAARLEDAIRPEDRDRVREAVAQMRLHGRSEIAARLDAPSGPPVDVAITFQAASSDPHSSLHISVRDISAGKRGDASLIRAKEAAEASNRAKTEFLAKISHDIRTPLNAILGSADLLSQTPLSFDQSEYVGMFQRNCRRLVALINDFLDFSRIEAGAVRIEKAPFRIREMVDDAIATFREAAARKGIALGVELDPAAPNWALGDPLRIQQVLVNLLSNALKFTESGRVDVNVKALSAATAGDKLLFEVCDTGPGIRIEDQDKIFARFVQLPNPSNGQRGAGLGLTICRDLVELMNGEIGVVSRQGRGSTFYFSLPLEAVEPAPARPEIPLSTPAELPSDEPVRILVAEDTEDNRLLLEHYLRDCPVNLRMTANGREALEAVRQGEPFDLILMDIDMPEMDGYTATREIRAWQQSHGMGSAATPIVALSADAMQDAVGASLAAGCVAHVAKPVDRRTLLDTIQRFAPGKAHPKPHTARSIPISDQVLALVPQYLAAKEKQIEDARRALASRDFGPIRRFGHNLKGTGRGYGFPPIEEMGREIERAAAQADAGRIAEQLDALHRFVCDSASEHASIGTAQH